MNDHSTLTVPAAQPARLGDRIRNIAGQLRQENDIQIKATARILGAAAQIAQNHDQLIDEVVEMVQEDLDQAAQLSAPTPYTVEQLKQQFKKLSDAKAHFGVKATSWADLAAKLNQPATPQTPVLTPKEDQNTVSQRLTAIEHELQTLRSDMNQALQLLALLVEKLS